MKFTLHALGLFLTSVVTSFVAVILVLNLVSRIGLNGSSFVTFLLIAAVFLIALLGTGRLYARHFRLSCPGCGKKLTMFCRLNDHVKYTCRACGFKHQTPVTITIGNDGTMPW